MFIEKQQMITVLPSKGSKTYKNMIVYYRPFVEKNKLSVNL